jgi:membrane dipeptidase
VLIGLCLSACQQGTPDKEQPVDMTAEARRIAESSIIIDTHIDVPMKALQKATDLTQAAEGFDFDYPRAIAGGLNAPFMSIYTHPKLEAEGRSRETAEQLIDVVEEIIAGAPDKFALALSPADVRSQFSAGLISLPMGMENGSPIEGDLGNVQHFYNRGVRYISLAHSLSNHISDSSYDENRQWHGLSEFGATVVKEMNRVGIMVDITHVSDDTFWQVVELSAVPVIASHSSARHFTPGFERNMSDDMIRKLAETGGVMQINFGSGFIEKTARDYDALRWAAGKIWMEEHPGASYADLNEQFVPEYTAENGSYPYASLDDVLDHFDHVVGLVGVDHVGIGSDFDGVGDSLPEGLKDVSAYPNLIEGLLRRGYSEADIRKILGENLLRVWSEVEAYASQAAITSSNT